VCVQDLTFKAKYNRKVYVGRYETFDVGLEVDYDEKHDPRDALTQLQAIVEQWIREDHIPPHSAFYRPDQKIPRKSLVAKEEVSLDTV